MEKLYTIKGNYAEIILSKEIYPLISVEKALANFIEIAYVKLNSKGNAVVVQIVAKDENEDLDRIVGEFYNECLRETLRYIIAMETKNLRELIVGRALYTTCIEIDEEKEDIDDVDARDKEYNLDEIAVNWFAKYASEEEKKC